MIERRYSVAEIDRMRSACQTLFVCRQGTTLIHLAQMREEGEDMLRTYLMAGTDPDELCALAKEEQERNDRSMESLRKMYTDFESAAEFAEEIKPKRRWWRW